MTLFYVLDGSPDPQVWLRKCIYNLNEGVELPETLAQAEVNSNFIFDATSWLAAIIRPHRLHSVHKMRATVTDGVAWSVGLSFCVCLLVTFVSPAKTVEPIEMPFGGLTHVGPMNHVLDGVNIGRIHSHPRGVTMLRACILCFCVRYSPILWEICSFRYSSTVGLQRLLWKICWYVEVEC